MAVPEAPIFVEVQRVAGAPTSLNVHFTMVSYPQDRSSAVVGFNIEWSSTSDFSDAALQYKSVASLTGSSDRLNTYAGVTEIFYKYTIADLVAGADYFVRVASVNAMGAGLPNSVDKLSPGSQTAALDAKSGVSLAVVPADSSVSVFEASSSLLVSFQAPAVVNGFAPDSYKVEWWTSAGIKEIETITLTGSSPTGTFTLAYDGQVTDSLSVGVSEKGMEDALNLLSTIGSVKVQRTGTTPAFVWAVTFLSEVPAVSNRQLIIDSTKALGAIFNSNTGFGTVVTPGTTSANYNKAVVLADDGESFFTYTITGLTPGQAYFTQVSASNALGCSAPQASIPASLAPPEQKPSEPLSVALYVSSGQSLKVAWSHPESNGGNPITKYKIEWDEFASFDSAGGAPRGTHTSILANPNTDCINEACSYTVGGLSKGVNYNVRVFA